jgi:hypothetical protein
MLTCKRRRGAVVLAAALVATGALAASAQAGAVQQLKRPSIRELAAFAAPGCGGGCGSGSTVGPDGALYVTDGQAGRVLRVDRDSGAVSVYAGGLPRAIEAVGIGGAIDVAFIDHTAYVLVTLVGPFFDQTDVVDGIYKSNRTEARPPSPTSGRGRRCILLQPSSPSRVACSMRSSHTAGASS